MMEQASKIIEIVAEHQGIPVKEVLSKSKVRKVAYTRALITYYLKTETDMSSRTIASELGWSTYDKSLVCRSFRKIKKGFSEKEVIRKDVLSLNQIMREL